VSAEPPLLSPTFLAKLATLTMRSRIRAAGVRKGERRSIRRGQSQEFADHRAYVPGDDLRHLDWHLFARLDSLFVKLFEEREDRTVQIFVDASASMEGDKLHVARQVAAAMAYVALGNQDRVCLADFAQGLKRLRPPVRNRASIHGVLRHLEEVEPSGESDLVRALKAYPRRQGSGIGILMSDLLFTSGYEEALKRLLHLRMELYVFHVLSPAELRPDLEGDILLVDMEDGTEVPLTVDDDVLDRYERTVRQYAKGIEDTCQRLGIRYTLLEADVDVEQFVMGALRRQGLLQ
jgi:uncharacterized protein (DUF58 family)